MEKCDKIVFALGAVIGAGLAMLVTNIRGYRAAVKDMRADDEDYDAGEKASENSNEQGKGE